MGENQKITDNEAIRSPTTALVFEIKGHSLDDGPGIRSVIFFKGCPLSCVWCHNPESKDPALELAFEADECIACDSCIEVCEPGALNRDLPDFVDRARCTLCFACTTACPSGALKQMGREMTVDRIVSDVSRYKAFFDNSGGGVTFSGGEATLHMDYAAQLAARFKSEGIHVLLETCGLFKLDKFEKDLLPHIDSIYYDLKLFDSSEHKKFCGTDNKVILSNFKTLLQLSKDGPFGILPRIPLVPGITDTESNLTALAEFLKTCGATQVAVLEYNPLWPKKMQALGIDMEISDKDRMKKFMSREEVDRCKRYFTEAGMDIP